MKLTWKQESNETIFCIDDSPAACILTPTGCIDCFTEEDGVIRWNRITEQPTESMQMTVHTLFSPAHTMIPSILYDGNPWGNDHEYKGYTYQDKPYTFAHHRCAVPGASSSWNDAVSFALYSEGSCSCSLLPDETGSTHSVLWPEEEGPRVLHARKWEEAYKTTIEPHCDFYAWLSFGDAKAPAWQKMLSHAWKRNYKIKPPVRRPEEIWKLSTDYARRLYTEEEDGLCAFSIGFRWNGQQWVKRPDFKYEIGWCGQNASLAVSLLTDYQMNGNQESLNMGLSVLDKWLEKARSANGLLLTRYDPPDSLIDACNLGTAGLQFFEAYDLAKQLGIEKPAYLNAAYEVCNFVLERQRLDGGIGMCWNRDGTAHELRGTAGAFLILPLAEAYRRTGKGLYSTAAVRAFSYYYREFKQNGYGTSGALDTCCIDKESIIPILKGALMLYKITGFTSYLRWAEEAAWYLSTWQWHHTVQYPADSVLNQIGYDTFGGTAVSTSHHHIDSFALCYVPELLELARLTGNDEWKERAVAIWHNGVQGISDGTLALLGKAPRPAGSSDEGYMHTRWSFDENDNGFSVSQWLVAWPCAFRLEILRSDICWNLLDSESGNLD